MSLNVFLEYLQHYGAILSEYVCICVCVYMCIFFIYFRMDDGFGAVVVFFAPIVKKLKRS